MASAPPCRKSSANEGLQAQEARVARGRLSDAPSSRRTARRRPPPTTNPSCSFLLSQWMLRLTLRHKSLSLGATNLRKNDQLLLETATPVKSRLMRGIATAALLLVTIPAITDTAKAGPGGGGGRGGGFGGHVGGRARGFAGRGGGLGFVGGAVRRARLRGCRIWMPRGPPFFPPA